MKKYLKILFIISLFIIYTLFNIEKELKIITTKNTVPKNITTKNIKSKYQEPKKSIIINITLPRNITTKSTEPKKMDTKESSSYNFDILISELKKNSATRKPKYILLFD